ncbi:hypothetical protein [Kordiimonas marina]|nr:hypothetical protein [Kordiimonas marina]MCJ9430806.1 hypothetical protein [Kordiimonas marina]
MSMRTYQHYKQVHRRNRRLAHNEAREAYGLQERRGVNDNQLFATVA